MERGRLLQRSYRLEARMVSFRCSGSLPVDLGDIMFRGKMSLELLLSLTYG